MSLMAQGNNESASNVNILASKECDTEIETLTEISEELTLNTEVTESEDQEIILDPQESIEHNEEVIHSDDIEPQEMEICLESQNDIIGEIPEPKYKAVSSVPPLRPLNIAPKPEPIALKSVNGQPLIFLPGGSSGQGIKLVNTQGQEISLANYSLSRPLTIKPTGKTLATSAVLQQQQKPIVMKKIITTTAGQKSLNKPITFAKPGQQFVVVQKAGDQQQVKVVQTASGSSINTTSQTKTITLQQAQEMGLLSNAKIIQSGQPSVAKRTVLINKSQPKTIKVVQQAAPTQIATSSANKTISLTQIKSPTKILPVPANKGPQRIILKSAGGSQMLPAGQLIQVAGTQGLSGGQIHQINVPGKGERKRSSDADKIMQYIKFVATCSAEPSNSTVTVVNNLKSSTESLTTATEIKPGIPTGKLLAKAANSINKPTQVIMVPAGYSLPGAIQQVQQVSKVAIPAINQPGPKPAFTTVPRLVTGSTAPSENSSALNTTPNTTTPNETLPNANGIRPRKPCNCTKSQCLKLYCDCFANGEFCYLCNCMNCFNNLENEETRNLAIRACLERNPNAFRPKIGKAKDMTGDVLRKHTKGCNCKRSGCLKNYCECYEAKIACSNNCKCVGCRNIEDAIEQKTLDMDSALQRLNPDAVSQKVYRKILPNFKEESPVRNRKSTNSRKQTISFITDDVIEATCQCLLTISDDADSNMQDEEITKKQIIEEFGGCLTEIIQCALNRNSS